MVQACAHDASTNAPFSVSRRLLRQFGTLISYYLISSLLLVLVATVREELDGLQVLDGLAVNLGGAVGLWMLRAVAVRWLKLPL